MAAHRYWRLNFTASNSGSGYRINEVELRTSAGGANAAVGGTATAAVTNFGANPVSAFDSSPTGYWAAEGVGEGRWLQYDMGAGNAIDVAELAITAHTIAQNTPKNFALQYSDDGASFTTLWTYTNVTNWEPGQRRLFNSAGETAAPSIPDACRYWRLIVTNNQAGFNGYIAELELRGSVGGSDQTGSGTAYDGYTTVSGGTASNAFDNDPATQWKHSFLNGSHNWFYYDFGSGVTHSVAEIAITAPPNADDSPSEFMLQRSEDSIAWATSMSLTSITGWTSGQTRTFIGSPDPSALGLDFAFLGEPFVQLGPDAGSGSLDIAYLGEPFRYEDMGPPPAAALDGTASGQVSATGELTTAIACTGSASAQVTATAELTTSIPLAGTATGTTTATAELTTAIALTGSADAVVAATAELTTAIPLEGSASVTVTATATALTDVAGAVLDASVSVTVTATGELTTAIALSGVCSGQVTASAELTTSISLSGSAAGQATANGELTTGVSLAGTASSTCTATGELSTAIPLSGSAQGEVTATGELTIRHSALAGVASASVSCSGELTTAIALTGIAVAQAQASASLTFEIYRALVMKVGRIVEVPPGEEGMHPALCAPTAAKPYFHTDPTARPLVVKGDRISVATEDDTVIR